MRNDYCHSTKLSWKSFVLDIEIQNQYYSNIYQQVYVDQYMDVSQILLLQNIGIFFHGTDQKGVIHILVEFKIMLERVQIFGFW